MFRWWVFIFSLWDGEDVFAKFRIHLTLKGSGTAERTQVFCRLLPNPPPNMASPPLSQFAPGSGVLAPHASACQVPSWHVIGPLAPQRSPPSCSHCPLGAQGQAPLLNPQGRATGHPEPHALCSLQVRQDLGAGHRAQPCPQDNVRPPAGRSSLLPRTAGRLSPQ